MMSVNVPPERIVSGDRPLEDPEDDLLGYAPFARHLATALSRASLSEGFVSGIYAPWGSGKSTALYFIEHYLRQLPEDEQPIIVRFNPWWFSGQEDLTRRFFTQITERVARYPGTGKKLVEALTSFASVVSDLPPWVHFVADAAPMGKAAKSALSLFKSQQKDVFDLRTRLEDELCKIERPIFVFIDDIDRLTSGEVRQVFRLVKAVGNLPNMAYLLAFDQAIATRALEYSQVIPGQGLEYLEKIIQVPFELPFPDKSALRKMLLNRLDQIIEDSPEELFSLDHWRGIYLDGVDKFISTPRDVIRFTNALSVTFPAVAGEVNTVDFIGIEAIRVFLPSVYQIIRNNQPMFTGELDGWGAGKERDRTALQSFHNQWLESVPDKYRLQAKEIVQRLFPKLQRVWSNWLASSEPEWRKTLRICSDTIFPVYFRLSVPTESISNAEILAFVSSVSDREYAAAALLRMASEKRSDGTTRLEAFLGRLEDSADEGAFDSTAPDLIAVIFTIADDVIIRDPLRRGLLDFGSDIRFARVVLRVLRRLDEPHRFDVLTAAINQGRSVYMMVSEISAFGQEHGWQSSQEPGPEDRRTFSEQHMRSLQSLVVRKIEDAVAAGVLSCAPNVGAILHSWAEWSDGTAVKQWVDSQTGDDEGLVELLAKFLQYSYSSSGYKVRHSPRLDPNWYARFLDPETVAARLDVIQGTRMLDMDEHEKVAVAQYLREYQMRQSGGDPSSPGAWREESNE